jgi:hypothetical protein
MSYGVPTELTGLGFRPCMPYITGMLSGSRKKPPANMPNVNSGKEWPTKHAKLLREPSELRGHSMRG